jgi:Tfp pilus assembly protein PilE
MIEMAGSILIFIGKGLMWLWVSVAIIAVVFIVAYRAYYKKYGEYKEAREQIFEFVKSYKRKCTGANRFVVTVPTLQDSFREYDTELINKVWLELAAEHVIEQDPQDNSWCIR